MTKQELLVALNTKSGNPESDHLRNDAALLAYINDADITKAFEETERWYS